jgi:hypothetical protein
MAREVLRTKEAVFMSRPPTLTSNMFSYGYKSVSLTTSEQQWRKMRPIVTSEILSPALERPHPYTLGVSRRLTTSLGMSIIRLTWDMKTASIYAM